MKFVYRFEVGQGMTQIRFMFSNRKKANECKKQIKKIFPNITDDMIAIYPCEVDCLMPHAAGYCEEYGLPEYEQLKKLMQDCT